MTDDDTTTADPAGAPPGSRPLDELLPAFPLARCARIAASLDVDPDMTADILRASELGEADWDALDEHWHGQIQAEIQAGKADALVSYDQHYVARIEEERGPILPREYAGLVVASERGSVDAKLCELGLPEESVLPIERVWMRRTSSDAALSVEVKVAVAKARGDEGGG